MEMKTWKWRFERQAKNDLLAREAQTELKKTLIINLPHPLVEKCDFSLPLSFFKLKEPQFHGLVIVQEVSCPRGFWPPKCSPSLYKLDVFSLVKGATFRNDLQNTSSKQLRSYRVGVRRRDPLKMLRCENGSVQRSLSLLRHPVSCPQHVCLPTYLCTQEDICRVCGLSLQTRCKILVYGSSASPQSHD